MTIISDDDASEQSAVPSNVAQANALYASIGLSPGEVATYRALLSLGESSTGKIIKQTGIPSSHIYSILQRLVNKGLVTYTLVRNTKRYCASDPACLQALYDERRRRIDAMEAAIHSEVRKLQSLGALVGERQDVRIYEGSRGIKTSIEKMIATLDRGETYYVIGAPVIGNKTLNAYYVDVHERRIKKGIRFKIIYNSAAKAFAKERAKTPLTSARLLDIDTPTEICVFGDYVQIILFSQTPVLIEIHNHETANSFLAYFNILWAKASPVR